MEPQILHVGIFSEARVNLYHFKGKWVAKCLRTSAFSVAWVSGEITGPLFKLTFGRPGHSSYELSPPACSRPEQEGPLRGMCKHSLVGALIFFCTIDENIFSI